MKLAILCSPVPGHLLPFAALGRGLIARGHEVVVPHMTDAGDFVRRHGLDFHSIGEREFPAGSMEHFFKPMGQLQGLRADLHSLRVHRRMADMMWRDVPRALERLGVDALLVDQLQPQGAAIAEKARLPFITVGPTLRATDDARGEWPVPVYGFTRARSIAGRLINRSAHALLNGLVRHYYLAQVNADRQVAGLRPLRSLDDALSPRLRLTVFPPALDFGRPLERLWEVVGPLVDDTFDCPFPWEQLDGRPIVYASLGTLRNQSPRVLEIIAQALAGRADCQLVLSSGAWSWSTARLRIPKDVVHVPFAPQRRLLERARLCITHGGANTVLESLLAGTPMVALPFSEDHRANTLRAEKVGTAIALGASSVTSVRLSRAVDEALSSRSMLESAQSMRQLLTQLGGIARAVDLILSALGERSARTEAA